MFGFYKIAVVVPHLYLGNPKKNAKEIISLIKEISNKNVSVALFPELCITGYTLSDLFYQENLYTSQKRAIKDILSASKDIDTLFVFGAYLKKRDRLYNCAIASQRGEILGIIPKSYIPNKREFYEKRHFLSGIDIKDESVEFLGRKIPFGTDILFDDKKDMLMGIEICEDLWAITPPSNYMAEAGANLILNLSASNELIGKAQYRAELVRTQSARLVSAYAYASSGLGESSTDTVFGGDAIIAEYGSIVKRAERFSEDSQIIYADIDLKKLKGLRVSEGSYCDSKPQKSFRVIEIHKTPKPKEINRYISPHPFIPSNPKERIEHCEEISNIQAYALIRRLKHTHIKKAVIGISGGLDSTLALLAVYKAFEITKSSPKNIIAVTMPGFGTTGRTYNNAVSLCKSLGVTLKEISIKDISLLEFEAIGHNPEISDITYENVQARARTEILMNLANKEGGLVIGTGDLSEIALGWSTYNGDHMSMYAINSSIPKTLIRYIIEYYSQIYKNLSPVLEDILNTPVSPELLPVQENEIVQKTEEIVGPYELHDFFLYHFLKYGAQSQKILYLAQIAFKDKYSKDVIKKWLKVFIKRFFTQQFKRSCMPDGPKVGTINLSPRADWRMPSDAYMDSWLEELED